MNMANLAKRLFFVLWAIPISWCIIAWDFPLDVYINKLLPPDFALTHLRPGHLIGVVLIALACWEYYKMLGKLYPRNGFWIAGIWLAVQGVLYFISDRVFPAKIDMYILLVMVAAEAFLWGKNTGRWKRASLLFSGTVFLYVAFATLLDLYAVPFQSVFSTPFSRDPAHWLLSQMGIVTVLASIFMCDSMAYFAGSLFGKHHFSSISPKKTLEGAAAGFITAIVTMAAGWHFFADPKYPLWAGILLGVIIGITAQLGDLIVSLMKRYFEVKDSSDIIPGHGGILDRFDSVFFTAPAVALFMILIHKFTV